MTVLYFIMLFFVFSVFWWCASSTSFMFFLFFFCVLFVFRVCRFRASNHVFCMFSWCFWRFHCCVSRCWFYVIFVFFVFCLCFPRWFAWQTPGTPWNLPHMQTQNKHKQKREQVIQTRTQTWESYAHTIEHTKNRGKLCAHNK